MEHLKTDVLEKVFGPTWSMQDVDCCEGFVASLFNLEKPNADNKLFFV